MGQLKSHHRPLTGGLGIQRKDASGYHGTLTAVARRQDDNEPVLVTNLHVVSSSGIYGVDGDESVYQWHANNERAGTLYTHNGRQSWGHVAQNDATSIDVAALTVEPFQCYDFGVHEHDSNGNPRKRPIVQPVREAEESDDLVQIGARSGVQHVTVDDPDTGYSYIPPGEFLSYKFANVVRIDRGEKSPIDRGDSGAPLLYEDDDGNYHLCCINFAAERNSDRTINRDVGYAIPASAVQSTLNITFGVKAPTAIASAPKHVDPGASFELNGASSKPRESGATITKYQWVWQSAPPSGATAVQTPKGGFPFNYPVQTTPNLSISGRNRLGEYTYKLTVTDSNGAKASDTVTVTVKPNTPPIAHAGSDQVVNSGATVTLDGSKSSDPDSDKLTFKWEQLGEPGTPESPGTPGVTLSSATAVKPTFTAPTSAGALSFKLTVTDSQKASHSDTVNVTVLERVVEALGTLDYGQYVTRRDDWSAAIPSVNRPGRYAKFYCFSVTGRSKVQIDLASSVDTFLCLLLGTKTNGDVLQMGVIEEGGEIGYKGYSATGLR